MENYTGSNWNKWDLHIHSPYTNINNKYNCSLTDYCKAIVAKELKVIGLTNYFFIHEVEYNEIRAILGDQVFIIPNVEFRTNDTNASNEYINIHVLFNPDKISIKSFNETLSRIELNNIASDTAIYCNNESIKLIGFDKVTISIDALVKQLKSDFNEADYLIAGVPNGYGGFHPDNKPRSIELAKKLDTLSMIMFGRKTDTDFFLSTTNERAQLGFIPKATFVCSDAHTINDVGIRTTWVKSEATFEGLKQIILEPKYRVENKEVIRKPHRTIESVKFEFPEDTQLKNIQTNSKQLFCLSKLSQEICFSPYFTCIIGGRGSGKSTIINLIAEKLGEKTSFFQENKIVHADKDLLKATDQEYVFVKGTHEIEFISQGKIEQLSSGNQLTDLIFNERIKAVGNEYIEKENLLNTKFQLINDGIKVTREIHELEMLVTKKTEMLENDKKIVASFESITYKQLYQGINSTTNDIEQIVNSKNEYDRLVNSLTDLLIESSFNIGDDEYGNRIREMLLHIENIDEIQKFEYEHEKGYTIRMKHFSETERLLHEKRSMLISLKAEMAAYFTSIGITADNIADVDRATSNIASITIEIIDLNKRIHAKKEAMSRITQQLSITKELASQCENIIKTRLQKINSDLDIANENVEKIRFEYKYNNITFKENLYSEFRDYFKSFHKSGLSWENINWCLDLIQPDELLLDITYEGFIEKIQQSAFDRNALYGRVFIQIFETKSNFEIYKLLIRKHIYNVSDNILILGYYGKLPLTSCSFGQRCTAVVITLLMTGLKPLLIDEPEAHLDNKLIAEYLVDLIKEKKCERQIIFATHNANFVVNGDAELIHILEIPKDKMYTEATSTTIENLTHRKSLLKLEGGEEAFRKRDKKLLASIKLN